VSSVASPLRARPASRSTGPGATGAVFRWCLRTARLAPLTWGLPLAALCMLEVAIYPSVHDSLAQAIAGYPSALKKAFNIGDLGTVQAYLDVEMFSLIVPLALAFYAIRSATRATVAAEERGWLDIVLTAPVTRPQLVGGSYAATMCSSWLVLGVVGVGTEIAGALAGAWVPVGHLLAGLAAMWCLSVLFSGIAVLAGGVSHRSAVVTAAGAGAVVTMYVLDLVGKLEPSLDWLRWFSGFRYAGSALQDGLDVAGCLGLVAVGLACAAAGAWLFARRDVLAR
jgi:ABC-2 type transport system permease protein